MESCKLIIYIAGKYNAPTTGEKLKNTHKAMDIGVEVYKMGHYPVIPHLTHWLEERMDYNGEPPRQNEWWYNFDNLIIPKCDALLKISKPGESKGADLEEQLAEKLGLKVYYNIHDLPLGEKLP